MILYYMKDDKDNVVEISTASSMITPYSANFTGMIDLEKMDGLVVANGVMTYDESVRQAKIKAKVEAEAKALAEKQLEYFEAERRLEGLDDEQALNVQVLFPEWAAGINLKAKKRIRYNGVLYTVLQDHTTQDDWKPDVAHSLYAPVLVTVPGEITEWVQPESTNGYSIGDMVTHNGDQYISLINYNVHEPGTDNGLAWKKGIV